MEFRQANVPGPRRGMYDALFALGFRPFYLLAAVLAALAVPLWAGQMAGVVPQGGYLGGMLWHAHEMVFGFAIAVIAGFLLTAVRNWTGLSTPEGGALAALAGLWLAGRALVVTGPALPAAVIDVAFLPCLAWALWQPLRRARNRNQFFVALLLLLAAANAAFHAGYAGLLPIAPTTAVEAALALIVLIVALMGGRVIPMFTRNAVPKARVRVSPLLDAMALAALAAGLAAWLIGLPAPAAAALCILAAIAHALRLWRWDPLATRGRPILWVLHLSYAWIPVGLLMLGLALLGVAGSVTLALHALAAGAVGGMIIGMITRTARGHTGRALHASKPEVLAYVLVHLGALIRVALPLLAPSTYLAAITLSAALWSAAFVLYAVVYAPILTSPRADGKPG